MADVTMVNRVDLGACWLDEVHPRWWEDIDRNALDLEDPAACVLGQVARAAGGKWGYSDLVQPLSHGTVVPDPCLLALFSLSERMTHQEGVERGFNLTVRESEHEKQGWRDLHEYWVAEIQDRIDKGVD